MTRSIITVFSTLIFLTACASGKFALSTKTRTFEPSRFVIVDTDIALVGEAEPGEAFIDLMEVAAENASRAYNDARGYEASQYYLELALEELAINEPVVPVLPLMTNHVKMTAKLKRSPDGEVMREYPVRYRLVRVNQTETKERQLLRGAIPQAMNGLYGLLETPTEISELVASDAFFTEPGQLIRDPEIVATVRPSAEPSISVPQEKPASETPPAEVSDTDGPEVIQCTVC